MQKTKTKNITLSRIFKLIKENNQTAKEFANKVGISQGNITDWKTGRSKPSIEALRRISKAYKIQLEWLTGDSRYRTKEDEFNNYIQRGGENERINKN